MAGEIWNTLPVQLREGFITDRRLFKRTLKHHYFNTRYVQLTSKESGLAATRASDEKIKKYDGALPSMEFLPICIEVLGPMDRNTSGFFNRICKNISIRSGDIIGPDYSGVFDKLTAVLKCVPVYDHIPKPGREKFAHDLNALLTAVCNDPGDPAHWVRLHCFVPYVLQKTSRGGRRVNQGNLVNKRLSEYSTIGLETLVLCFDGFNNAKSQKHNPDRWINAVSSCIEQLRVFPALTPTAGCVSPAEVLRAVKSFKNGSSGGLDGLRPQHLKDVFSGPLPIDDTLNSLTQFINLILSGACPLSLSELEFALGRVSCLSAHDALTIIRNALSLPKLMYFLRTSKHIDPSKLGEFDGALRTALSSICNVQVTDMSSFYEALNICQSMDSLLASVGSVSEKSFIADRCEYLSRHDFWIGMYRLECKKTEPHHYWLDGSDFVFSGWNSGQPNSDVCCARMNKLDVNWGWSDKDCRFSGYRYICEKPLSKKLMTQKRAIKRLSNKYVISDNLQVVQNRRCSTLYCISMCAQKWICAGFNLRPLVRGGCQCELKDARSWLTLANASAVGTAYWSYPIYGYDKI
ncbi:hypothetical protein HELRODRAFT_162081 [Helobdella robusta]|uniref:C-type lectin domain-containing protein n=1 Tax=Helobdella robusta TaxID=6412 RepID=T1ES83_HELRO|nr:hypothetical protein HELRODRAFT_162081 [Helobdella robusta]ESN98642.1 hypothetical protein HELRODRAFT_162081 [Helobdella robusta]